MHLTQREQERLLIYVAADVARRRKSRGLKLNYPEAVAILTAETLEAARDGKSVAEIMTFGTTIFATQRHHGRYSGNDPRGASGSDVSGWN